MNRLIIIGNGFDLAHGLKTSFNHIITNYIENAIKTFFSNKIYSDNLLSISENNKYRESFNFKERLFGDIWSVYDQLSRNKHLIVEHKSQLLKSAVNSFRQKRWVDIELEFFEQLKGVLSETLFSSSLKERIINYNISFDKLKDILIQYLKDEYKSLNEGYVNQKLVDCFTEKIPYTPNSLYFLNFNYTNTLNSYIVKCEEEFKCKVNHIHGSIDGRYGSPVFGFGDELDKHYIEFEDKNNNELFKHIKSFDYLKENNYSNLMSFIDSEQFEVQLYGHSCGLSDRTMLNEIFEHKHCTTIRQFYYKIDDNTDDYTERTYEISRHFTDKKLFRRKLVPFPESKPMPQPDIKLSLKDDNNDSCEIIEK